jgi:hypothetical protein
MDTTEKDQSLEQEPSASARAEAARGDVDTGHDHDRNGEHGRPTITPAEAFERIARGETIEGVRVVDLVLKGTFEGPVRFRDALLIHPVIDRSEFRAEVAFEHCTLDRPRFGPKTTFGAGLDLRGSTLARAIFRGLVVRGAFRLDNAHLRGQAYASDCTFEGRVRAWETQFGGWMKFERCTFEDDADFRSFHADEGFVLDHCTFARAALFRGATCTKKWDATDSHFHGLLDLSKAKLHDFVYLEGIGQGDGQRFAFHNALAERLLIRTDQLHGRLDSEARGDHARAMQEYGLLKRAFEGLHRYEHEDWAFYRFKVNQRRCSRRSWRRPWTKLAQFFDWLLLDVGCGYGTNPLRAVRAALVIMLAFSLIYIAGAEALPVETWPFPGRGDAAYFPNRVLVGLLTSVSVFTSGFGTIRDAARGWMNIPLIVESLLGTLLWGLFIVAFSRKVIR